MTSSRIKCSGIAVESVHLDMNFGLLAADSPAAHEEASGGEETQSTSTTIVMGVSIVLGTAFLVATVGIAVMRRYRNRHASVLPPPSLGDATVVDEVSNHTEVTVAVV
jgi:hypothetical protein